MYPPKKMIDHELYIARPKLKRRRSRKIALARLLAALFLAVTFTSVPGKNASAAPPEAIEIPEKKGGVDWPKIPKPETPAAEPDEWSSEDIERALKTCEKLLSALKVEYKKLKPIKSGLCGDPAPVKVSAIGEGENRIVISPAATLNCKMTAKLAAWFKAHVQPQAKTLLKTNIIAIQNIASYACRRRYSNPKKPYSEHAFLNALDIAAFVTKAGKKINLIEHWGITQREIATRKNKLQQQEKEKKEKERAARKKEAEKKLAAEKKQTREKQPDKPGKGDRLDAPTKGKSPQKKNAKATPKKTESNPNKKLVDVRTPKEIAQLKDPKYIFLHQIYDGACSLFGTVLSPEANHAHRNHFHIDLAPRKRSAYCE